MSTAIYWLFKFMHKLIISIENCVQCVRITILEKLFSFSLGWYYFLTIIQHFIIMCSQFEMETGLMKRILLRCKLDSNPCRFGVRIVLLYPPACRKRRLKGGGAWQSCDNVCGRYMPLGVRSPTRPGQKFGLRFLLHAHHCSASGTTTSGTRASPKPGNSPR